MEGTGRKEACITGKMTQEEISQENSITTHAGSELVLQDVPGIAEAALGARPQDTGGCNRVLPDHF